MRLPTDHRPITRPIAAIRSAQIISLALVAGLVSFAMVVALLQQAGSLTPSAGSRAGLLLAAAAAMWGASALAGTLLRRGMLASMRRSRDWAALPEDDRRAQLASPFATRSILWAALLEGPGLFGVVVLLMTGSVVALIPTFLSVCGILLDLPTPTRFERYVAAVVGIEGESARAGTPGR